jgi:hypothetical protein
VLFFAKGFIPQSINIGIDGDFALVSALLMLNNLLVTELGQEEESVTIEPCWF